MFFRYIPIILFILPILSINLCYFLAASYEHVAWCFPYLDGCTSISATGRMAPESYIFRATMIPAAVLMALYWMLNYHWLVKLGDKPRWPRISMVSLGVIAAVFLIAYTSVLGAIGAEYQTIRRVGVTSFFSFTFLAQLLLASRLWHLKSKQRVMSLKWAPEAQIFLCALMLILGLLSIPLSVWVPAADNIVEWNFSLLLNAYYLISYYGWKATQFSCTFSLKNQIQMI